MNKMQVLYMTTFILIGFLCTIKGYRIFNKWEKKMNKRNPYSFIDSHSETPLIKTGFGILLFTLGIIILSSSVGGLFLFGLGFLDW